MPKQSAALGLRAPFILSEDDGDRDRCREVAENSDIHAAAVAADAAFISMIELSTAQFFPRANGMITARGGTDHPAAAALDAGATLTASLP